MSSRTTIDVYPNVFSDAADREIGAASHLPAPYRPRGITALFKPEPSLGDHAAWYREFADLQRAKLTAVEASVDLARGLHKVGRLPSIFAADDRLMQQRFANDLRREEILALQMDVAEEELVARREKIRLGMARDQAEQAKINTSSRSTTASGRRFGETLKMRDEIDRQAEEAIAAIRDSDLSPDEKAEKIRFIREQHRRATMEDG